MSRKLIAIVIAAASSLGACAPWNIHSGGQGNYPERNEVPIASNFATSTQLKLQAAEHWRRVAYDSADALVKAFEGGGKCIPRSNCITLYLRRSCETGGCAPRSCDTTFNQVFFNEFLTALVGLGYQVSATPLANVTTVEIDIQAVGFAPNRPQYRYAGNLVEMGPGLWAISDSSTLLDNQGSAARRTDGTDANWFRTEFAAGATPRNELVVTVSALSPQKTYLGRNTKVYYTSDADAAHYVCSAPVQEAPRATTTRIPVLGDCSGGRCAEPAAGRR